jgi:cytochrome P450
MTTIEDLSDRTFDPYAATAALQDTGVDPYLVIAELRSIGPVVKADYRTLVGLPAEPREPSQPRYSVLSHAAVDEVLNDPETFSSRSFEPTLGAVFGRILTVMDPPEHAMYRRALMQVFRPTLVRSWCAEAASQVIEELLAPILLKEQADLASEFATPYPFHVLQRILGLPHEDVEVFQKLSFTQMVKEPPFDMAMEAAVKLGNYFTALLDDRRQNPGTDLISALATLEAEGRPIPRKIVIPFLRQLMSAGAETTSRALTILFIGLLSNPEQLAAVRADRALVSPAVEEALRWDGPVIVSSRETTRDVVLEGVSIPRGALLELLFGAANRDPQVFENPDTFDVHRERHRHFGFATGIHVCIGQLLARLEMSVALNAVLDRLPNLGLDPNQPPPRVQGASMRLPSVLHVTFGRLCRCPCRVREPMHTGSVLAQLLNVSGQSSH